MKKASVLITDVDNTLYDFMEYFIPSFYAMVDKIVEISGVPEEQLLQEYRKIHQDAGTSEYVFGLQELPSLQALHPGENLLEIYDEAIHEFRKVRKEKLKIYESVIDTLKEIKAQGTRIVAYTESPGFHTHHRFKALGLDGLIDVVYSPPDHEIPDHVDLDEIRSQEDEKYRMQHTEQRYTPRGVLKPNTEILEAIITDLGIDKEEAVFIGDSIFKDIAMAQDAGVTSIHAQYGNLLTSDLYKKMPAISYWQDEDFVREKEIAKRDDVQPDIVLERVFGEILDHVQFTKYEGTPSNKSGLKQSPFSARPKP